MSDGVWKCSKCGGGCVLIMCNACPSTVVKNQKCNASVYDDVKAEWVLIHKGLEG